MFSVITRFIDDHMYWRKESNKGSSFIITLQQKNVSREQQQNAGAVCLAPLSWELS